MNISDLRRLLFGTWLTLLAAGIYLAVMSVELSHLMQLALGQRTSLQVGDLPRAVAERLKCHPAIIYLGRDELLKIAKKHPEIQREELQKLPFMLKDGHYLTEQNRPTCMTVIYRDPLADQLYMAALKATLRGGEVWVSTFHRTNKSQAQRKLAAHLLILSGKTSLI